MTMLAEQPNSLFIGQSVVYGAGISMHDHLAKVPMEQRIEFPVAEELQLGSSIGLAIQGFLPISIYPRMDFLMRAMDQLVNHLDKLNGMSRGQFNPKVIVRTRVGPREPLFAGPQHTQNHCEALRMMLQNVSVFEIEYPDQIMMMYRAALQSERSVIVVENLCS